MKSFALTCLLIPVFLLGVAGCAATDDSSTSTTSTARKSAVPGEDVGAAGTLSPTAGANGAGANVNF